MSYRWLWALLPAVALMAQERPKRPPRPGVSTPGVKREMTALTPAAVFPVPGTPDWQVVTEDAVWVSNAPKNTVHRLDAKTNQVVATVEAGKSPCSGLAERVGRIWGSLCRGPPHGEK